MHCKQLVKPFLNDKKFYANFRSLSNFSSCVSTLFSIPIKNDQAKKNLLMTSRNIFSSTLNKSPSKSSDKEISKKNPALSLKYDLKSNKVTLQLKDKNFESTSSSQGDNKFCSICNLERCKLLTGSSENNDNGQLANNDPDTITILVDKDEFCRTICSSSSQKESTTDVESEYCPECDAPRCKLYDELSEKNKVVGKGSEYCSLCDAPKCKLEANLSDDESSILKKTEKVDASSTIKEDEYCDICKAPKCKLNESDTETPKGSISKETEKVDASSTSKEDEYCDICKAPRCKLEENDTKTAKGSGNKTLKSNIKNEIKTDGSSNLIRIVVDKAEICREICNSDNLGSPSANSDNLGSPSAADSKSKQNTEKDIKKSPGYCSACNLEKCKYEKSKTSETSTSSRMIESTDGTSNSSEKIIITLNKSDICGLVCGTDETFSARNVDKTKKVDETEEKDETKEKDETEKEHKTKKGRFYCDICKTEKCKYAHTNTEGRKKNNRKNFSSSYKKDHSFH